MAVQYRPRIIKQPATGLAYLMTCKKESAKALVKSLVEQGIPAVLTGTETTEQMDDDGSVEKYAVSQIDVEPPADFQRVKAAVDSWLLD